MLNWLFGRKRVDEFGMELLPENELHGFDLDVWNFLGTSEINFVEGSLDKPNKILRCAEVFFFMDKKNDKKRDYLIFPLGGYVDDRFNMNFYRDHIYGVKFLPLWKAGESEFYYPLHEPSVYTLNRMKTDFGVVYNFKERRWEHPNGPNKKVPPALKEKPKIESQENNVVKVNFKDRDEDK